MPKTNKSILKRLRITKRGQILQTGSGINHFQAKKSRSKQLLKKRSRTMTETKKSEIMSYLYHG